MKSAFCVCVRFLELNIKAMQDNLGHADGETTMDIYAEATKELKKAELKSRKHNPWLFHCFCHNFHVK